MRPQPRAGWYPDHQAPEGHLRYWDGSAWTEKRSETSERRAHEVGPVREWVERAVAGAVLAAFVAAVTFVYQDRQDPANELGAPTGDRAPALAGEPGAPPVPGGSPGEGSSPPAGGPTSPTVPGAGSGPRTYLVESVLDGDTVRLSNGAEVRLVGVRAPEPGECGSEEAVAFLSRLVDGEWVALRKPGADKGPDGRLLRYVVLGSSDVGLRLLREGLAVADDSSWLGDGRHPRQETYRRADAEAPAPICPS